MPARIARDAGAGGVPGGVGSRAELEARAKRMREFGRRPGVALHEAKPVVPPAAKAGAGGPSGDTAKTMNERMDKLVKSLESNTKQLSKGIEAYAILA